MVAVKVCCVPTDTMASGDTAQRGGSVTSGRSITTASLWRGRWLSSSNSAMKVYEAAVEQCVEADEIRDGRDAAALPA